MPSQSISLNHHHARALFTDEAKLSEGFRFLSSFLLLVGKYRVELHEFASANRVKGVNEATQTWPAFEAYIVNLDSLTSILTRRKRKVSEVICKTKLQANCMV